MPNVTVEELNGLVTALFETRITKDEIEEKLEGVNAHIKALEGKVIEYLTDLGLETFKGTHGTVTPYEKSSYKIPATPEDRARFFQFLKERGEFDGLITVNYQTLNGWAEREYEAAKARGDIFFTIPGLGAPTITKILSKTKKKA